MLSKAKIIKRELDFLNRFEADYYTVSLRSETPLIWEVTITTDEDSVHGVKTHKLEITMGINYPFSPPRVRFIDRFTHACVNTHGFLDLDILGGNWTPALSLGPVIISVASFINEYDFNNMRSRQHKRVSEFKHELVEKVFEKNMKNTLSSDLFLPCS